jgi:hypothetical protein
MARTEFCDSNHGLGNFITCGEIELGFPSVGLDVPKTPFSFALSKTPPFDKAQDRLSRKNRREAGHPYSLASTPFGEPKAASFRSPRSPSFAPLSSFAPPKVKRHTRLCPSFRVTGRSLRGCPFSFASVGQRLEQVYHAPVVLSRFS